MESTIIVAIIAGLSASFFKPIVDAIIASFRHRDERKEQKEDISELFNERITGLENREIEEVSNIRFCQGATHLLLKDRVTTLTRKCVDKGEVSLQNKAFITESVELLHTDGENGAMTACVKAIENLKVV